VRGGWLGRCKLELCDALDLSNTERISVEECEHGDLKMRDCI
jgi:hypothetical protein